MRLVRRLTKWLVVHWSAPQFAAAEPTREALLATLERRGILAFIDERLDRRGY